MTEEDARAVLGESVQPDGTLDNLSLYLYYDPAVRPTATLDGEFTIQDLEAIACWMRLHPSHD
jgi:hypothetical protein